MAVFDVDLYSEALQKDTVIRVILPNPRDLDGRKLRTMTLLHGRQAGYSKWMNRVPMELYVRKYKLAVIMPDAEDSYYTNIYYGNRYWEYISEEMLPCIRKIFPILSEKREDNYAAGSSMGGYGAMKLALSRSEVYGAAASLAGAVSIFDRFQDANFRPLGRRVFGDVENVVYTENDLFYLVEELVRKQAEIPRLYVCCGRQDFLYESNVRWKHHLEALKVDFTYEEWDGVHDWIFWDKAIRNVLNWLKLDGQGGIEKWQCFRWIFILSVFRKMQP